MLPFIGAFGDDKSGYAVERSLLFTSANSAYLNRLFGAPTDNKKWTLSLSVKRMSLGANQELLSSPGEDQIRFTSTDQIQFYIGGGANGDVTTTASFKDTTAHYHISIVFDATNATAADRAIIYVNGVRQAVTTATAFGNVNSGINSAVTHTIGRYALSAILYLDALLSDIIFVDGQALAPSSFGAVVAGEWALKAYKGTFGNNGFNLRFSDNSNVTSSTLGKDAVGSNNWTPNNFSVTPGVNNNSFFDVPTNFIGTAGYARGNFCVLNPHNLPTGHSITEGGLRYTTSLSGSGTMVRGTVGMSSGKWFWEVRLNNSADATMLGIAKADDATYNAAGAVMYYMGGIKRVGGADTSYGAGYGSGDVIGFALDMDAGTLTCYKNGVSQGVLTADLTGTYFVAAGDASSSSNVDAHFNFGQRPYTYAVPAGFNVLCTQDISNTTVALPATFVGNASADGPYLWANGIVNSLTINGNVATDGTHYRKVAGGIKIITSSASYNTSGSNTITIATYGAPFKNSRAQVN